MRNKKGRFTEEPLNEKYGHITILGTAYKTANNQYYVRCMCDCGNEFVARKTLITTGKQNQCSSCSSGKGNPVKQNTYEILGAVTKILFENGDYALIDTEDLEEVKKHYWNKHPSSRYVFSYTANMPLHRYVYGNNVEMIDHVNGDTSDNRKCNLRECTPQQNAINRKRRLDNKSGVTGVYVRNGKYIAQIGFGGKKLHRTFRTFDEAVLTRKRWEKQYFGEWASNGR